MSQHAARAFGEYLERLRGRRGLSIGQVSRLAAGSAQKIDKSSLWRLEQGRQQPSLFALLPLSRIYDASANVLIERLELDMELERIGAPDTEGMTESESRGLGHASLMENRRWEAYGYFRAAVNSSHTSDRRRDVNRLYLASVARSIGKNHFALHEFQDLLAHADIGPERAPIVLERISHCLRCTDQPGYAEEYADLALAEAQAVGQSRVAALAHSAGASLAIDQGEYGLALEKLRLSYKAHREADGHREVIDAGAALEVALLLNFADVYAVLGQSGRSKRAALTARRIGQAQDVTLGVAYGSLILGVLLDQEGFGEQALQCWSHAARSAARVHHTKAAFSAELHTYRYAVTHGLPARARAARRRLDRLAPWVAVHCRAYREWRELRASRARSGFAPSAAGAITDAPEPIEVAS